MSERIVTYTLFSENVGIVTGIYSGEMPSGLEGISTDSTDPVIANYPNMVPVLRVNLDTKELYYDYISSGSLESQLKDLKEQKKSLEEESTINQIGLMELHKMILAMQSGGEVA